ncbi:MAG: hypothetical protein ABIE22_00995 [archaeon]
MRDITGEFDYEAGRRVDDVYMAKVLGCEDWEVANAIRWWEVEGIADLKRNYSFLSETPFSAISLDNIYFENFHPKREFDITDLFGEAIKGELSRDSSKHIPEIIPGKQYDLHAFAISRDLIGYKKLIVFDIYEIEGGEDSEEILPIFTVEPLVCV